MIEHRRNNCETAHILRSTTTMKMSTATTSSTTSSTNRRNKKTFRFSLKRTLHLTLLTCLLLQLQVLHTAHASADYSDDGGSSSEIVSSNNDNDDVYEPAQLQQAVETIEQRNEANLSREQSNDTDNTDQQSPTLLLTAARVNVSTNQISIEESSPTESEEEKATREQINNMKESSYEYSSEEDTNMKGSLEAVHAGINAELLTPNISATPPTTMIPQYLQRKAKAELFNVPTMATAASEAGSLPNEAVEEDDVNASISDYMEDDDSVVDARDYQSTKQAESMPLAMKYYRTAGMEIEEDNNLSNAQDQQLQRLQPPIPLPQQQLLPKQHLDQQFHNNSEEEYYEDSREESLKQLTNQHMSTTAPATTYAPATAAAAPPVVATTPSITTTSAMASKPIDIVLASIGGIPLPRTTTTTTTTTKEITVPTASVHLPEYTTITTTTTTPSPPAMSSVGSTETSTTTTTLTTTAPATTTAARGNNKQGKQINVLRRKMLPHEQLRNYIEDAYIRMPLAVIVDPSTASLEKTKALWRDALRTNLNIKIVLVSLNTSGVPAAYSFNNTRQFLAGLNSIKENNGGNAFIGIVHASELVPYDSAVFISTAAIPPHTELVQDAAITLLKKRIRLYLIWYGERSISENETQEAVGGILGEVAIRSGGDVLHIVGSEDSQELEGSTPTLVADVFRGSQEVDLPIDTTLSSLHVKIDAPMRMATLETPNGG